MSNDTVANIAKKLNPFVVLQSLKSRAMNFLEGDVDALYRELCRRGLDPSSMTTTLLAGIYVALVRLNEAMGGENNYDLTAFQLQPNEMAIRVVEASSVNRSRRVLIWVDPLDAFPIDARVRWSTSGGKIGPVLSPGFNELGRFPGNKQLFLRLTGTAPMPPLKVFVAEET